MNKRSREILSQLITKTEYSQTISIQELADMFKVSSRTIRYDIDQINDYLKENHLQPLNLGKRGVINTERRYHESERIPLRRRILLFQTYKGRKSQFRSSVDDLFR